MTNLQIKTFHSELRDNGLPLSVVVVFVAAIAESVVAEATCFVVAAVAVVVLDSPPKILVKIKKLINYTIAPIAEH